MSAAPLTIFIRQHQFSVRCGRHEEDAMRAAARAVEEKLRAVREQTKVADGERAALMAALQIAFEADGAAPGNAGRMLRRIDAALARTDQFLQERATNGANQ